MAQHQHFDFYHWEKAFDTWDDYQTKPEFKVMFIISTAFYISGYWIVDADDPPIMGDLVYRTDEGVQALKQRIIAEHKLAKEEGRSPRFTD